MKKFNFSLVVILMMIFAFNANAQTNNLVDRETAIERLQSEVIAITNNATHGYNGTAISVPNAADAVNPGIPTMVLKARLLFHEDVLNGLLEDSSKTAVAALADATTRFSAYPGITSLTLDLLNEDVIDLLD